MDVPLPLVGEVGTHVEGIGAGGMRVRVPAPPRLRHAVQQLGLSRSLGYLRLLRVRTFDHSPVPSQGHSALH